MDAVIGNKYVGIFNSLNIEVSKKLEGEYTVDEIISTFENFFFNKMFLDITSIKDYKDLSNLKKLSMGIDMDKVILFLDKEDSLCNSKQFLSKLVSMGIYNFTDDVNNLMYLYNNTNNYRDVAYLQELEENSIEPSQSVSHELPSTNGNNRIILGVKNVTDSAGSTTLAYLIKNVLSEYYSVMALEINKNEFIYFNDKECISVSEDKFNYTLSKYDNINFFVVDLGKSNMDYLCNDLIYLVEPSTIKLNKLMLINSNIFKELKDKKVVLNKSLLNDNDIASFEVESNIDVFYNMKPINDKGDYKSDILPLLEKLGYVKLSDDSREEDSDNSIKKSIFDLFRMK